MSFLLAPRPQEQEAPGDRVSPLPAGRGAVSLEDHFTYDTIVFEDGSSYTGTLKNGVPEGLGTCSWKDGNQYDGEWRNGVMHGFGTYLWTSGQRYDGEWKDGKRDGIGVKRYADGSTFDGFWLDGKKHGVGVFRPAEPDKKPSLRRVGSGKNLGELAKAASVPSPASATGDAATVPAAGEGRTTPTGSLIQAAAPAQGEPPSEATLATPTAPAATAAAAPAAATVATVAVHMEDAGSSAGGALPGAGAAASGLTTAALAAQEEGAKGDKGAAAAGTAADGRKAGNAADSMLAGPTIAPERKVVFIRRFEEGRLVREDKLTHDEMKAIFKETWSKAKKVEPRSKTLRRQVKKAFGMGKKLQQKQGQLIYKGMPGYDLMVRLQLGIRYSIGRINQPAASGASMLQLGNGSHPALPPAVQAVVPLVPRDFVDKAKVFFPSSGSNTTPAHPSSDFKYKDYSPKVFRNMRHMWGVNDAEYMLSLGGSSALRQLNSPGKSGCMFFLSDDEKFLIKTMRKSEIKTLIAMLPQYYAHMEKCPQSLVTRFYGVHGVKQVHGRTVRFVVMSNIFNTDLQIHKKFDLKGSTFTRTSGPHADQHDPKTIFKDLDLDMTIRLPTELHDRLMKQLGDDAAFLHELGVMDYSLLLGVHFCSRAKKGQDGALGFAEGAAGGGPDRLGSYDGTGPLQDAGGSLISNASESLTPAASPGSKAPAHATPPWDNHSPPSAAPAAAAPGATAAHSQQSQGPQQQHGAHSHASHTSGAGQGAHHHHNHHNHHGHGHGHGASITVSPSYRWGPGGPFLEGGPEGADGSMFERGPRNFDLFSNKEEIDKQVVAIEARMRELQYSEQRIQDILGLAKLKFLGDKLKKSKGPGKRGQYMQSRAAGVIKALAQARQEGAAMADAGKGGAGAGEDQVAPLLAAGGGTFRFPGAGSLPSFATSPFQLGFPEALGGDGGESEDGVEAEAQQEDGSPVSPHHGGSPQPGHTAGSGGGGASGTNMPGQRITLGLGMPALAVYHSPAAAKLAVTDGKGKGSKAGKGTKAGAEKDGAGGGAEDHVEKWEEEEVVLFFGIIDILQDFNVRKFFERGFKSIIHDSYAISVAPPGLYADRFLDFMVKQVFPVPLPDNQTVPHAWAASLAYSPTLGRAASLSWPSTTQGHSTLTMHPGGGAHGGWHAGAGGPGVSGKSVIGGHLGAGNPRAETILEDDGTGGEDDK